MKVCAVDMVLDVFAIIGHLFTLAEIAQLCPKLTPPRVFMLVQSLIAAPAITSVGEFTVVHVLSLCCLLDCLSDENSANCSFYLFINSAIRLVSLFDYPNTDVFKQMPL